MGSFLAASATAGRVVVAAVAAVGCSSVESGECVLVDLGVVSVCDSLHVRSGKCCLSGGCG